jgi:PAS domain S-box-containing protein
MIDIPGYQIQKKLYESHQTLVYRGIRKIDSKPVILKILKGDHPSPASLAKFRREYDITKSLAIEGVINEYGLENYQNSLVMILEDFGGESLARYFTEETLNLESFLNIAIRIADTLGRIHQKNIIHKDINPSNIVWNAKTGEVKIIDFGISTELSREVASVLSPEVLEGTLSYMSPEQTGRMNRAMDYRTDFYSLGISFYFLLTGQLPFQSKDPIELVHFHMAKMPPPLYEINSECPRVLSDIVLMLMAKNAEDRYQSAIGITSDLKRCLSQLKSKERIDHFEIGKKDMVDRFQIPQKLYGREKEIHILLNAFDRVANGSKEMMLVAGISGIGKSALVHEVHKPIVERRGYFISGKFDQFHRGIPYSSIIQAFKGLVLQILSETEERIALWKSRLLKVLGPNSQVIIDVIPEVELILGIQPDLPELGPQESLNRFEITFQNFMGALVDKDHPLVIFLDDLQWVDLPSLKLIQSCLLDPDIRYLFIIGAYRDNEVDSVHPLMLSIEEIRKSDTTINTISLEHLSLENINQLISETLYCQSNTSRPLSELCLEKTMGNPFFLIQFLHSLYSQELIVFEWHNGSWQWNLERIRKTETTANVVDLMVEKIYRLPEKTRHVTKLAAVIGAAFDLKTLSIVNEKRPVETADELWESLKEGLILPTDDSYKFLQETDENPAVSYRFLHDRVQQAAYSLITDDQRMSVHLKVGQLMLQTFTKEESDEKLFDIVNHLNLGSDLINDPSEREKLSEINLRAGLKAKASAAYEPAFNYLMTGIKLLETDYWNTNYDMSLKLFTAATEAAYFCTNFAEMDRLSEEALNNARTTLDKVKIYTIRLLTFKAQRNLIEAVNAAYDILELLGLKLPRKISTFYLYMAFLKNRFLFRGKRSDEIINLPEITDPYALRLMETATSIGSVLYSGGYNVVAALLVLKIVNLSLKHGTSSQTAYSYANYGFVLCSLNRINPGYRFGKIALSVADRYKDKEITSKVICLVNTFVLHWKNHLKTTLAPLLNGYQYALDTGDLEAVAWDVFIYCYHSYFCGCELKQLENEMTLYSNVMERHQQGMFLEWNQIFRQTVLTLLNKTENGINFDGKIYNEDKIKPALINSKDRTGIFFLHLNKLILCYLFYDYDAASENASLAKNKLGAALGLFASAVFYFYRSLNRIAIFEKSTPPEKKKLLKKITYSQKKLKKWADRAPANHLHKYYLVEAEKARVLDQPARAMDYYTKAIERAKENEFIQEEALANELAGKFYLTRQQIPVAKTYLQEALYLYSKWGAKAKVNHLEKTFPRLLGSAEEEISFPSVSKTESTVGISTTGHGTLDLISVMKASQAISGEIVLSELLKKMVKIVLENGGAEKGFLLLEKEGQWVVEAEGSVDTEEVTVLQSIPANPGDGSGKINLPLAILHYVERTKEIVVIDDDVPDNRFASDPYIIKNRPKSILCQPIIHQGKITCILYLENNLTTGAFTPDRVEVLKHIASQAAISIENAKLYEKSQQTEKKYHDIVENAVEGMFQISVENRFISVNTSMANFLGYDTPEELLEANLDIVKQCFVDINQAREFYRILREKGHGIGFEMQYYRKDGSISWGSITARPVYDDRGELSYFEGSLVDIMARKEKENAERAREAAEAATRAKSGFLATMSHEIRTPMNAILGMTELLTEADLSPEHLEYLKTINSSGELLLSIINDILDFSKIESGQIELEKTIFNLSELAKTSCKILSVKAHSKKLKLNCRVNPDIKPFRLGDPTRIRQIFINLLSNAIKFTDTGEISLEILKTNHLDLLKFCVSDTGIGIPEDKQLSIFDSFSQVDTSTTRKFGGTGLGLAICKRLVELMNGRIWIESEERRGTKFYFTALIPETDQTPETITRPIKDEEVTQKAEENSLPSLRILLAEDIASNQKVMQLFLRGTPAVIDIAENGKIAFDKYTSNSYDVILMDIEMPIMDGLAATKAIRDWEEANNKKETPVIALTAHAFDEQMKKCFDAGCNGFLPKPVKKKDVIAILAELFNKKKENDSGSKSDTKKDENSFPKKEQTDVDYKATINADLKELVPDLFKEIIIEIGNINSAIKNDNFELINRLGHGFKGATATYGLDELAKIFLKIENNARIRNKENIIDSLAQLKDYIANIEIKYVRE